MDRLVRADALTAAAHQTTLVTVTRDDFLPRILEALRAKGCSPDDTALGLLADGWGAARGAYPGVGVDGAAFAAWLADRVPEGPEGDAGLARLRVPDLYLACGCVAGDGAALAAFEWQFGPSLDKLARRFEGPAAGRDELVQAVRVRLCVGDGERPPKLGDYAGIGFLENWIRVAATRAFIDAARSSRSRRRREEVVGGERPRASEDLELAFLKESYRAHFRVAFAEAIRALPAKDRVLLRQHTVEQSTIDDLAGVYGVHRATIARRIEAARELLMRSTRAALRERLRVPSSELESVLRLVRSNLDLSVSRLLASGDADDAGVAGIGEAS